MPRSIVVGKGKVMVAFDADYALRDILYPQVGLENHTAGSVCRTGFFLDGRFAWETDGGWERELGYAEHTLVTAVTLRHAELGLTVRFSDYVDMARDWLSATSSSPATGRSRWPASSPTTTGTSSGDRPRAAGRPALRAGAPAYRRAALGLAFTWSHAEFVVTVEESLTKLELVSLA